MNVKIGPSIYGTKYAESVREYGAGRVIQPFKNEAQTALFKAPVRTVL
jgi:hypothetical protein